MIEISFLNETEVIKGIETLRKKIDPVKILDDSIGFLLKKTQQRFLNEVNPEGVPWIPSQAGIARKQSGGSGTLFDSGNLFRSMKILGKGVLEKSITTNIDYAHDHQFGKGQEVREFFGVSVQDINSIRKAIIKRFNS
jgi:phage gpG-like protein